MMQIFIVLSAVLACAFARPGVLLDVPAATLTHVAPLAYAKLVPGAPIGLDGRVVDTPEVALAKAEHAAAHINQKIDLAKETVKSVDSHHVIAYGAPVAVVATEAQLVQPVAVATKLVPGAPIGLDGRVVDTPEVALAKAEHAVAHVNERLGHEAAKLASSHELLPVVVSAYATPVIHSYVH